MQSSNDTQGRSTTAPVTSTLIVGCGYLGLCVARHSRDAGHQVYATTRRRDRAEHLSSEGFTPLLIDWTDGRTLKDLPDVDRILVAVSYDRQSRRSRFETQVGGLRRFLDAVPRQRGDDPHGLSTPHICYISTTGVYHQSDGRWVNETSPTHPSREGGRVHLQAEQVLLRHFPKVGATILRLAGIYGPGRVPRVADVIAGRPIRSPEKGFLNLIHVEDASRAVMQAWHRAETQQPLARLYVVADDEPVIRGEFYREIARQCGAPVPRFELPKPDAPTLMRSDSNKRVWNRRMKADLIPKLTFPTYREGLADVLFRLDSGSPSS